MPRRIVLDLTVSLDGFIEGPNGGLTGAYWMRIRILRSF